MGRSRSHLLTSAAHVPQASLARRDPGIHVPYRKPCSFGIGVPTFEGSPLQPENDFKATTLPDTDNRGVAPQSLWLSDTPICRRPSFLVARASRFAADLGVGPSSVNKRLSSEACCHALNTFLFRLTSAETPPFGESPDTPLPRNHLTIQNAKKSSASGFLARHLLPPNTRQASLSACGFQAVQGTIWKLTGGPRSRLPGAWQGYRGSRILCGQVWILMSGFRVYVK